MYRLIVAIALTMPLLDCAYLSPQQRVLAQIRAEEIRQQQVFGGNPGGLIDGELGNDFDRRVMCDDSGAAPISARKCGGMSSWSSRIAKGSSRPASS